MLKKILFFVCAIALSAAGSYAQLSGYFIESFEATTFPPTGWQRINSAGAQEWVRSTSNAKSGVASAFIRYEGLNGEDWLITPQYHVNASTDSMTFWIRLGYVGYQPDSLVVKVSTTGSATSDFTVGLLTLQEGVNYPPNTTNWYRFGVPLGAYTGQNIYLAFRHGDQNGDGLYLDDVTFGTLPANDALTQSIDVNPQQMLNTAFTPQVTFKNNGSATQTFNVVLENDMGYMDIKTVNTLAPGAITQVFFNDITFTTPGLHTLKAYTTLAGDENHLNDTLTQNISVIQNLPNGAWQSRTPMPDGRWANATVAYHGGIAPNDTPYIVEISGYTAAFTNTNSVRRYNVISGVWDNLPVLPLDRAQVSAGYYDGKLFVFGGYTTSFDAQNTTFIYDMSTGTWSTGAPLPIAVGDYALGQYADSLFYIIGGYNSSTDQNMVQLYNAKTDTWTAATPYPGVPAAGLRAGVAQNQIVLVGGYNQSLGTQSQAFKGAINPSSPDLITWTNVGPYPGGPAGRLAGGGIPAGNPSRIFFTAGDPNGNGVDVLNTTYAYNINTNGWEIGPLKTTAVSNVVNVVYSNSNDSAFMVVIGGYNGSAVVSVNEWLYIGSVDEALPVHLISFGAHMEGARARINWQAAEDGSAGKYVIEKSVDGKYFNDLLAVAAGRVPKTASYTRFDENPFPGRTFYRLRLEHTDGSKSYSQTAVVMQNGTDLSSFHLWPSPAVDAITITATDASQYNTIVLIIDASGKTMATFPLAAVQKIDIGTWPAGIYTIRMSNGQSLRFEKQ